nr:RNA-directed DNA polymerase, eukaryota [Tanacetum cinerariifolium]
MRNKPGIDNLDIDDMYNNLKVYEADIKGSFGSSSNSQDVTFISAESTSSTNELNAAYSVSTATGHSSQAQGSLSYNDELMYSCFANQFNTLQLDNEDLEQTNQDDLEEMDLKWQVAMLFMRVKRFFKKTMRKLEFNGKEPVGFDKTNVECFNCHRRGHFARDCRSAMNSRNRSRNDGNAGYRGRDNDGYVIYLEMRNIGSKRICRWWDLDRQNLTSFSDWQAWFLSIRLPSKTKMLLEGVFYVAWWYIWGFRIRSVFDESPLRRSVIFDDLVSLTFNWCSSRCYRFSSWDSWLKTPHLISL